MPALAVPMMAAGSTTTVDSMTAAERRLLRAYTKDTQRRARTSACGHESATYKEHGPARARDGRTQRVQLQRVRGCFHTSLRRE